MLIIPNETNNTQTLVVGNHIIFNYSNDPDCQEYCYIDMNEMALELNQSKKESADLKHLEDIKTAMDTSPDKWGFYENWEQAMIDTGHHHRVVESCMRQHQATDYMLSKHRLIYITELMYFLNRIEVLYDNFLRTKEELGAKRAIEELEDGLRYAIAEGEKGYAPKDACIGMELMKRRLAIGGKRFYIEDAYKTVDWIDMQDDDKPVSYEDVVRFSQRL